MVKTMFKFGINKIEMHLEFNRSYCLNLKYLYKYREMLTYKFLRQMSQQYAHCLFVLINQMLKVFEPLTKFCKTI